MRRIGRAPLAIGTAGAVMMLGCTSSGAAPDTPIASDSARESYSLGVMAAEQIGASLEDIDTSAFVRGFGDSMHGRDLALDPEQMSAALGAYEQRMVSAARAAHEAAAATNRAAGDAFREEFSKADDVVALDNGILYRVIEAGDGATPGPDDVVTVHYRGSLVDGSEFDSSYARTKPVELPVDQLMPGWTTVLEQMKVGSKWQVVLPPEQAYGARGAGDVIGPDSTLVFELELLAVS